LEFGFLPFRIGPGEDEVGTVKPRKREVFAKEFQSTHFSTVKKPLLNFFA